jgi:hypothetical protein
MTSHIVEETGIGASNKGCPQTRAKRVGSLDYDEHLGSNNDEQLKAFAKQYS